MVDVTAKAETAREAVARGRVRMAPKTVRRIREGQTAKGDVLAVAQIAGVMGAKRTSELIPLCHPLGLTGVEMSFRLDEAKGAVEIQAIARTAARTGVEMEALTAVATAALALYDMCKGIDREMVIEAVRLVEKTGGKSGVYRRPGDSRLADEPAAGARRLGKEACIGPEGRVS
ncbi:MAG TPA: cyclic pyranopterin monophosphate synthase MoaC [Limnochordia bacterium]